MGGVMPCPPLLNLQFSKKRANAAKCLKYTRLLMAFRFMPPLSFKISRYAIERMLQPLHQHKVFLFGITHLLTQKIVLRWINMFGFS